MGSLRMTVADGRGRTVPGDRGAANLTFARGKKVVHVNQTSGHEYGTLMGALPSHSKHSMDTGWAKEG